MDACQAPYFIAIHRPQRPPSPPGRLVGPRPACSSTTGASEAFDAALPRSWLNASDATRAASRSPARAATLIPSVKAATRAALGFGGFVPESSGRRPIGHLPVAIGSIPSLPIVPNCPRSFTSGTSAGTLNPLAEGSSPSWPTAKSEQTCRLRGRRGEGTGERARRSEGRWAFGVLLDAQGRGRSPS